MATRLRHSYLCGDGRSLAAFERGARLAPQFDRDEA